MNNNHLSAPHHYQACNRCLNRYTDDSPKNIITFEFYNRITLAQRMPQKIEMHICMGSSCFSRGNRDVVNYIRDYLKRNHLEDRIVFKGARCMNLCSNGPNLKINDRIIEGVTLSKIDAILEKEFGNIR
ncbi:MAG: (2Fe-2S) ferredoxin domain-containing protein [Bacteroidales bacterium]